MVAAVVSTRTERPRQPRRTGRGRKAWSFVLALAVQLGFLAVLVFSVQWQNRKPEPVTAELYAPPVKAPVVEQPKPPPPPPVAEVKPPPPPPKPEPVAEKPDPREAEIALKAKQDAERKQREEQERRAREAKEAEDKRKLEERRRAEAKEAEDKRKLEERKLAEAKERQQAEAKERQQKEMAAMRLQAEREMQLRQQAERELQQRQAQQAAEVSARSKAEADWIRRIQAKVKGNVIVPADLAGNPEAIFEVVQLPTGEIIEATMRKSSGNRAYDDAVQRAILKSSPLPRPDRPDLFQRSLRLTFRPHD